MNAILLNDLIKRRDSIRLDWISRLQGDDRLRALEPRVDGALDALFRSFHHAPSVHQALPTRHARTGPCPSSPAVQFFLAGERALLQTALRLNKSDSAAKRADLAELYLVLRRSARKQAPRLCAECFHSKESPSGSCHRSNQGHQIQPQVIRDEELIGPYVNAREPL